MSNGGQEHNGFFDRFAATVGASVARAWFFSACVMLIVLWIPSFLLVNFDTWQLLINTATTIITFLLVALLQNTQDRSTRAITHKLDAALNGLVALLRDNDSDDAKTCVAELRRIAGVEMESSQ